MATANDILAIARKELGTKESPAGSNNVKYNTWYYGETVSGSGYPWCMAFVQWVFNQCGARDLLPALTASCTTLMNAAKKYGLWVTKNYQPGDVLIYDWGGDRRPDHTGILEKNLGNGKVQAIEGNTAVDNDSNGGEVMRRTRKMSQILGAVRPKYTKQKEDDDMDLKRFKELWGEMRKELQDNDSGKYSEEARAWAVSTGLIQGNGKTANGEPNYMWQDFMDRQQFITVLYRFAKMMGKA